MKKVMLARTLFFDRSIIVVMLFFVAVFTPSCGEQAPTSSKTDVKQHASIDYFGGNTTVKIHETEYTLIDDYIKWVPVLYQERNFNAIEQHISILLRDNNEAKAYELYILYHFLANITHDKHVDLMQGVLDEWCSKYPESHIPWLVRGKFCIEYAWNIRESGWAKSVPKEGWKQFYAKLELAKKDLEKSWELNPDDPNSSCYLLIVAKGLSYPKGVMEQYYKNGISVCPWHYGLCAQKLEYLKPKWHGSSEEMFEFAQECLIASKQYPSLGLMMVSAFTEDHFFISGKEDILGKATVWPIIEDIYSAFFSKYPDDIRRRFFYAYHAYTAGKYDIALSQFEITGNRWTGFNWWRSLKNYNDCRAFTYYKTGADLPWEKQSHGTERGTSVKSHKGVAGKKVNISP